MSGSTLFLACSADDFDASTQTCAAPFYTYPPSFLPYMSLADGLLIGGSIVGVWALGAVFRVLVRVADYGKA